MVRQSVTPGLKDGCPSARGVLEFECGLLVYEPSVPGGYWRLWWVETGRRRDTTARSRGEALSKAAELVERLSSGVPTALASAKGRALVEHYLDPARPPVRGRGWSERHREEQESYCRRLVLPVIAEVPLRSLTRAHLQAVLDQAKTVAVAGHLRRCLTAMVAAGLEEGLVLARQDVLRGVRWRLPAGSAVDPEMDKPRFVEEARSRPRPRCTPWPGPRRPARGCGGGSWRCCWSPTRGCAGVSTRR